MTVFENIPLKDIGELAEWLDKHTGDDATWMNWFDKNYCKNCEGISIDGDSWGDYCWCEIFDKCKFFPEMYESPDCVQIIKLWLESEVEDN